MFFGGARGLLPASCRVAVWVPDPRVLLVLDEVDECPAFAVDGALVNAEIAGVLALVAHDDAGHPVGVRVPVGALFRVDVVALGGDLLAGAGAVCVAVVVTAAGCRRWGGAISDLSNFPGPGPVPARPHWATGRVFRAFCPSGVIFHARRRETASTGLSGQSHGAGPGSAYAERGPKGDERGRECAGRSRPRHQHRRALSSGPCAGVRASCPSRSASRRRAQPR